MAEFNVVTHKDCEIIDSTREINERVPAGLECGICHIFCPHTTAGITVNENADPDVRTDLNAILNRLIKEREPYYQHTFEGDDDMPAHAKATIVGQSISIPITDHRLNLGTWQGIYLMEFRNHGGCRNIVCTIIGE